MKILSVSKDGGKESNVWAYWLVEIKSLFSVALLVFEDGTRDAYHSHAFNCVSWILSGRLVEEHLDGNVKYYWPNIFPIWTYKDTFHKVRSVGRTYVLTFRGPWDSVWFEQRPDDGFVVLTHGRKEVK